MRTISLPEACSILEHAGAVVVDHVVTHPALADLNGDPENEFLCLAWTDEEGREFAIHFSEGPNVAVELDGATIRLVDTEGEKARITILMPANLEAADAR